MDRDETGLDPPSTHIFSHQTTEWPLNTSTTNTVDIRAKRKSLRVRPPEPIENAEPSSPLNFSFKSAGPSTTSRMSLFHLFSKPKVERQRGYAEKGVDAWQPQPAKLVTASTPNLVVHVQPPANNEVHAQPPLSPRTDRSKSAPRVKWKEPPPRDPAERRNGVFEPPPLFQAYPQSVKDGMLEVSDMSPDTVLHKAKGKRSKAESDAISDAQSYKTKKSSKSTFRHVGGGGSINVELPRKIFVLVTSGYLLQYSENGPSDRLPEKMLHLGKESAAFACDLLPGKHYVLQVSQAVDQEGVIVANSGSIFSKLGIRSAAAKRMVNGFLLVMPSAKEMESWMSALRDEIEHLGGKKIRPDTAVRPKTGDNEKVLNKTLSHGHRYQIKRNPNQFTRVTSPLTSATNLTTETTFMLPSPDNSAFLVPSPTISMFPIPSPSRSPKIEEEKEKEEEEKEEEEEDSDTATIDGIEMEASKLEEEGPIVSPRKRTTSDAPSISSSAVVSVEHQQLNNVRNSFSNSTRTSHTSQAGTVVTTITSRTNSLVGSPPSPGFLAGSLETARDVVAPLKAPYRPLASAGYGLNRRRSAVPLPNQQSGQALPALNTSPAKPRHSVIAESQAAATNFSSPTRHASSQSRLTAAQSEPNLKGSASIAEKHDSKISTPPPLPTTDDDRPESFVGDLPPPSTWSSTRLPTRRTSLMQPPPTLSPQIQTQPDAPRSAELNKPKRMSFSMPLKVNPQIPTGLTPPTNNRRRSQLGTPDPAGEQPIVHTLTAQVDSSKRISVSQYQSSPSLLLPAPNGGTIIPKRASVAQFHTSSPLSAPTSRQRSSSNSPGPRLSLFPNPITLPANIPPEPPQRSSSAIGQTANNQPLPRPISMQVRSDHALFLQSLRNSTGPPDGRAVPIRGMKPSRSATNVAALASQSHSAPLNVSSFAGLKFDTPTLSEESDQATPLPDRALSPLPPPRPGSRSGTRKGARRSSALPELDLGIPVVGLGPPAPPPSAPLPLPPPGSRTTSPAPSDAGNVNLSSGIEAVAGLGIRVS